MGANSCGLSIWLENLAALTSLRGLEGLSGELDGGLLLNHLGLKDLSALKGVSGLGQGQGWLYVASVSTLQTLNGLQGIQGTVGGLILTSNRKLEDVVFLFSTSIRYFSCCFCVVVFYYY